MNNTDDKNEVIWRRSTC